MSNTYNTGSPVGSTSVKDLSDNASNFDEAMNLLGPSFTDRKGKRRQTWYGMEKIVSDFLEAMGFEAAHLTYVNGTTLTVQRPTQLIDRSGSVYKVKTPATFPVVLSGNWATDSLLLVDIGDAGLRALLASPNGSANVSHLSRTLAARFDGHRVMKDGGAVGNGTTNDQAAIEAELSAAAIKDSRYIEPGNYLVTGRPLNPKGIQTPGPGAIVSAVTGGLRQWNTYAHDKQIAIGREHLSNIYKVMMVSNRAVKAYAYGDSTVGGGFGYLSWPFFLQAMLPEMWLRLGAPQPLNITNRGVGGQAVGGMDFTADLTGGMDLMYIKYGINDGTLPIATRLQTYYNSFRQKLTDIRAHPNGQVYNLSIMIVGPNSTFDTPNGRDAYWYEQLRGIHVQLAEEFQCAFYDPYMLMQDSSSATGEGWLSDDVVPGSGRGLHPTDIGQPAIWAGVTDFMIGGSQLYGRQTNNFVNTGGTHAFASTALLPNQYRFGITVQRARQIDGWPEDGALVTTVQQDFICRQELFPFVNNRSKQYMRNATTSGNYWNLWTGQRQLMFLSNGWSAFGGSRGAPSALLTSDGSVVLSGSMKGGTAGPGVTACTLPAGMRPQFETPVTLTTSSGTVRAMIFTDGSIQGLSALDTAEVSFGGITIQVAN